MSLTLRRRWSSNVGSSLWFGPVVGLATGWGAWLVLRALDEHFRWTLLGAGVDGTRAILAAISAAILTFIVCACSALLITVQLASAQLTPRVITTMLGHNRTVKSTMALFVFTFVVSTAALGRTEDRALQLPLAFVVASVLASLASFFYLVDHWVKELRPVTVVGRVAAEGRAVIEELYPELLSGRGAHPARAVELAGWPEAALRRGEAGTAQRATEATPERTVFHLEGSAILVAVDLRGLARHANAAGGIIELVPRVGDFVAVDEPLFRLHASAARLDDRVLRQALLFGGERTLEQDPLFAFRILVDIAIKALSPAINDPTTAVLALDQIHRLLRQVGVRRLDNGALLESNGTRGVVFKTPNWEDFVTLAVVEIRICGAGSLQVVRRLRAMLNDLIDRLVDERRPLLQTQLRLLDRAVERSFPDAEDRAAAGVADFQGVGGSLEAGVGVGEHRGR
jgi:uncharacterized membrane protein